MDDSGRPKYGKRPVAVARQDCGNPGKTANCQVAVSLSLATKRGSVPLDYRLYLPKQWAADTVRRTKGGVPAEITLATKPECGVTQMQAARAAGVPPGVVLADAAYGDESGFRDSVTALGLPYVVGIRPATTVWAPGVEPLPPKFCSGPAATPKPQRREPGHEPIAGKALAMSLPADQYQSVTWRDGINAAPTSRFTCLRVRPTHQGHLATTMRPEEWLLIEWPQRDAEPSGYWLATAPPDATLKQTIFVAKVRRRIERDYRELKQEFGLSHYEGRNWRGFHHHAPLWIATSGFLTAHRLTHDDPKKRRCTKNVCLTRGLCPSRTPARRSVMRRMRSRHFAERSHGPSRTDFPDVPAAARSIGMIGFNDRVQLIAT